MKSNYGNIEQFNGEGYVSFLDILGFSNEILNSWGKGDKTPLDKILAFKEPIINPINREEEPEKGSGTRKYSCRTHTISDSIIVSHGVDKTKIIGDLALGMASMISNISQIWNHSISIGYTIRGAIDFGEVYWDKMEIIGPSFIKSYSLESKVAKVSRIIISSDFNKLLQGLFLQSPDLMSHQARYFMKDIDGYIIINPHVLYADETERIEIIEKLEKMRNSQSNFIIQEKYTPLLNILKDKSLKNNKITIDKLGNY